MGSIINNFKTRLANEGDLPYIKSLLNKCKLTYEDIDDFISDFIVVISDDKIVGTVGLEIYGKTALLRSFAVDDAYRSKNFGTVLYEDILTYAKLNKVNKVYLLTTTAEKYFAKKGFSIISRIDVPPEIKNTAEYNSICPSTAVCMFKELEQGVIYAKKELLKLKEDVSGASMWAVALDKAMFTYFEVSPNCKFERHTHESEQITFVLEGELFFDICDKIYCIKSGEVIAVPSNIPHSVYTKEKQVKAVDAWSPVMDKYK